MGQEARHELIALINRRPADGCTHIARLPEGSILLGRFLRSTVRRHVLAGEMHALFQGSRAQVAAQGGVDDVVGPVLRTVWQALRASHGRPSDDDG